MSGRGPLAGCAAVLAAALAGSVLFSLMAGRADTGLFLLCLTVATIVAASHTIFIALPAYLALLDRWPLRWWSSGLAGFLIGAVPISLLSLLSGVEIDSVLSGMLWFGGSGLVGGLVFCAVRGQDEIVEAE